MRSGAGYRLEQSDFNGQSIGGKIETRLEIPVLNISKLTGGKNEKPRQGGFEVKNLSYTYSFFKENHSMESKMIEIWDHFIT